MATMDNQFLSGISYSNLLIDRMKKHLQTFGVVAAFLLFTLAQAATTPILGSKPEDALRIFRRADADCHYAHCRQPGSYALGTSKGKTHVLYYTWDQAKPLSLEDARKFATSLIPNDAQALRVVKKDDGSVAEVFNSETLVKAFGATSEIWMGAKAGTFVVFHSARS